MSRLQRAKEIVREVASQTTSFQVKHCVVEPADIREFITWITTEKLYEAVVFYYWPTNPGEFTLQTTRFPGRMKMPRMNFPLTEEFIAEMIGAWT